MRSAKPDVEAVLDSLGPRWSRDASHSRACEAPRVDDESVDLVAGDPEFAENVRRLRRGEFAR